LGLAIEERAHECSVIICPKTGTIGLLNVDLDDEEKVKSPQPVNEFVESLINQHYQPQ